MGVYLTARRKSETTEDCDWVLMDGDQVLVVLGRFSSVEKAYQIYFKKSFERFSYRASGHLRSDWSDEWDQFVSDRNWETYMKETEYAKKMVRLLEPHRNAPTVEADWQRELRERREAEEAKSAQKISPNRNAPIVEADRQRELGAKRT